MKMYKTFSIYLAGLLILLASCSKEGNYDLTETPPLDFKSYYSGLTVTFVNQSQGATNISWDFGDNSSETTGDSVVHTYTTTGNYLISMTGTVSGKTYTFHTVLRVDKPSVVSLTDNSFADWNGVNYSDFQLEGTDHVMGGKVDYDANYIYIFLQYNTAGTNGLATLDGAIMDLYMDTDNSITTGFSSSLGADMLGEGNLPTDWMDLYKFSGTEQSAWSWVTVTIDNAMKLGYTEEVGDTVRIEFGISRNAFNINGDAFAFQLTLNYSDWSGELGSLSKDNETRIAMEMNKQE